MSLESRFDLLIFDWAGTMVDFGCEAPVKVADRGFWRRRRAHRCRCRPT